MNNQRPAKSSLSRSPAAKLASLLLVGVLALAVYKGWLPASVLTGGPSSPTSTQSTPASSAPTSPAKPAPAPESSAAMTAASSSPTVADLFRAQARDTWVETSARVTRLLDDDRETSDGSDQHQRFLAETTDNITILVSHNIDAASRVPLRAGDTIRVRGKYEWSSKGGTIHFTHAPKFGKQSPDRSGWIEHDAKKYD